MLRNFGLGLAVLAIVSVASARVDAADFSGEFYATFTIGGADGSAVWTSEQIGVLPLYHVESSTGISWTALSIGKFVIWRINQGIHPWYLGTTDGVNEAGEISFSGEIWSLAGGFNTGEWAATKEVLKAPGGTINEAGSPLP